MPEVTIAMPRSTAPARTPIRSIFIATVMLAGVLLLAWGYLGGVKVSFYAGISLILLGVIPALVFGVLGKHSDLPPSREHAPH